MIQQQSVHIIPTCQLRGLTTRDISTNDPQLKVTLNMYCICSTTVTHVYYWMKLLNDLSK